MLRVRAVREERYWYPDEGGTVWLAEYQLVDDSGSYLARDAPELAARGLRVCAVARDRIPGGRQPPRLLDSIGRARVPRHHAAGPAGRRPPRRPGAHPPLRLRRAAELGGQAVAGTPLRLGAARVDRPGAPRVRRGVRRAARRVPAHRGLAGATGVAVGRRLARDRERARRGLRTDARGPHARG